MAEIRIGVEAEVRQAVQDLGKVNAALTEQERTANKLELANKKLDDAVEKLRRSYLELNANTDPAKQDALRRALLENKVAADGAQAEVQKLSSKIDKLGDEAGQTSGEMGKASLSLTDLKSGLDLAGQAFGKLQEAFDATVVKAANWGDDMGDLAQLTGQSVKATSEMAATMELVGIKADALGPVLKSMTKQGLQLNLDTLKKLSAEYQALQDPVAQNAFLFKNFGRAGADLAEIMGRSTEELDRLGAAARRSGKVIDDETAAAAENLNVEMAILQQRSEGVAISLGNTVIPWLNKAARGFDNLTLFLQASQIQLELNSGSITREEAAMRAAALTGEELSKSTEELERDQMAAAAAAQELEKSQIAQGRAADGARLAAMALAVEQANNKAAADDLAFGMRELTTQVLFNEAAAGLDSRAALELARAMGLVNEDAIRTQDALENLKKKYDINRDGTVSATEATQGYIDAVRVLQNNIERLQDKKVTVTTEFITVGNPATDLGNLRNNQRASGGPVTAGVPYLVGESGPEMFVPTQSGVIVPNSQINMGGVNISVNGARNPVDVAQEVARQIDNLGRRADARART